MNRRQMDPALRSTWILRIAAIAGALLVGGSAGCAGSAQASPAAEPDAIVFCATLSPDEESAPTYSNAKGVGKFTLQRSDLKFSWDVQYAGLSGPAVQINAHGPQRPGANAPVMFSLGGSGGMRDRLASPLADSLVLDDGQLKVLLNSRLYINIATKKYPLGELRGQLKRVRPGQPCDG